VSHLSEVRHTHFAPMFLGIGSSTRLLAADRVRVYGEQRLSPTPSVSQAARKHTDFFRSLTGRLTKIFWAMPSFGNSVHPYPQNLEREKGKSIRNMKFRCVTRRENTAPSLQGLEYTGCDY